MITQMGEQGRHNDTLRIAADGSFAVDVNVQQTGLAYLLFEDLKASSMLFLEPGMKADLQISFGKKMSFDEEVNSLEIVYTGDNKDVFEFENGYDDFVPVICLSSTSPSNVWKCANMERPLTVNRDMNDSSKSLRTGEK